MKRLEREAGAAMNHDIARDRRLKAIASAVAAIGALAALDYAETQIADPFSLYTGMGLMGSAGVAIGAWLNRSPRKAGWYLVALGNLSFVAGDVLYWQLNRAGDLAFPSWPDIPYLAGYPVIAIGLALIAKGRPADRSNMVDALILATGAGVVAWMWLMAPYATDPSLSMNAKLVSVAYPLGDVMLLAAVCWFFSAGLRWNRSFVWLGISVLALLVSDVQYAVRVLQGTYEGGWIDAGYLISYATLAAAGLDPSMRLVHTPQAAEMPRLSARRLLALGTASILGPGLLVASVGDTATLDLRVLTIGSLALFLLALIRMAGLMRAVERKSEELAVQKTQLGETLADLRTLEQERRRLLEAVIRASENERTALAADLHDGPVQHLSTLGYESELAAIELDSGDLEACRQRLIDLREGFEEQVVSLRNLMVSLRPPVLDERGLAAALTDQARAFTDLTGIRCDARFDEIALRPEVETILYRVTQEALANVRKHAHATGVTIRLHDSLGEIRFEIDDDGVGFDVDAAEAGSRRGHIGLVSMRERVELAGGRWELESAPGRGTRIGISFQQGGTKGGNKAATASAR